MKALSDTSGLTIVHDTTNSWLYLTWRGGHSEDESKAACLLILDKIRQTSSTKILNDATLDKDGWSELTHWIAQDYFQALVKAGVSAIAWVIPKDLQARTDMTDVLAQTQQTSPNVDTFYDIEAAYHWLHNVA